MAAKQLVVRVLTLKKATKELYEINTPAINPAFGKMIDEISEWLLALQDQIGRVRRLQKTSIFTIWLSDKVRRFGSEVKKNPFKVSFSLKTSDTLNIKGLLRGITFEFSGRSQRPLQVTVTPPATMLAPLIFGRVFPLSPSLDIKPQQPDATWNGNPYNKWTISSQDDWSKYDIKDIAMHLWLAYR